MIATIYDETTRAWVEGVTRAMQKTGGTLAEAQHKAQALLERTVEAQAAVVSFEKVFFIMGAAFLVALPLLLLFKKGRAQASGEMPH